MQFNILFWTEGKGTGHIKRANALARGFDPFGRFVTFRVCAPHSNFSHHLRPGLARSEVRPDEHFDVIILDQRLDLVPRHLGSLAPKFVQLCKLGTRLEDSAEFLRGPLTRISFENCKINLKREFAYFGSLLDADVADSLPADVARTKLEQLCYRKLEGRLGLTMANTFDSDDAFNFLRYAIERLLDEVDVIVATSDHLPQIRDRLGSYFARAPIAYATINPVHPYLAAFDAVCSPLGYNTYCETQLFFNGPVTYVPMRPLDQRLRVVELPKVERIANAEIARYILEIPGTDSLDAR